MKIIFHTTVRKVDRREEVISGRMVDSQPVLEKRDLGWYVLLDGSREALHVGFDEQPGFKVGDAVTVTIAKVPARRAVPVERVLEDV